MVSGRIADSSCFKSINPSVQIIAIGDLAQNIYRFRGTSNEFLRTLLKQDIDPQIKTFTLTMNFRSTKSILELANAMFEEDIRDGHIRPMVPGPNAEQGMKPKYFEFAINPGSGTGEYEELVALELLKLIEHAKANHLSIV
jgi:superfamily I DNA/RNA helicase